MFPAVSTLRMVAAGVLVVCMALLYWQNAALRSRLLATQLQLSETISRHNAAVERLKADSDRRTDAVKRAIETAPRPRSRVTEALRQPPRGSTVSERVQDIDRRFMEALQ